MMEEGTCCCGSSGNRHLSLQLHKWPTNLPSSFMRWQLGIPFHRNELDESPRFATNVLRQLFLSRAPREEEEEEDVEVADNFDLSSVSPLLRVARASTFWPPTGERGREGLGVSANHEMGSSRNLTNDNVRRKRVREKSSDPAESPKRKKWLRSPLNAKWKTSVFNQYLMLKNPTSSHRIFLTPSHSLHAEPYQVKFTIKDVVGDSGQIQSQKDDWKYFDIWHVKPNNPAMDEQGQLQKVPSTLMVLNGRRILLYDVNNGKSLGVFDLSFENGPSKFSEITADDESDLIYVTGRRNGHENRRDGEIDKEFLILKYPPMRILYRLLIPKGGQWKGVGAFDILSGMVGVVSRSSRADTFNLESLIDANISLCPTSENSPVLSNMKTIILKEKPETLLSLSTVEGYLTLVPLIHPPAVMTAKKDKFELYQVHHPEKAAFFINKMVNNNEIRVDFFDNEYSRAAVYGSENALEYGQVLHKILQFRVNGETGKIVGETILSAKKLFAKPNAQTLANNDDIYQERRREGLGLRQIRRQRYSDDAWNTSDSSTVEMGYDAGLDLLSLCLFDKGVVRITVVDNMTMKVVLKLPPFRVVGKPNSSNRRSQGDEENEVMCSNLSVHFHEWYLCLMLSLHDLHGWSATELYTLNLLGELVSE